MTMEHNPGGELDPLARALADARRGLISDTPTSGMPAVDAPLGEGAPAAPAMGDTVERGIPPVVEVTPPIEATTPAAAEPAPRRTEDQSRVRGHEDEVSIFAPISAQVPTPNSPPPTPPAAGRQPAVAPVERRRNGAFRGSVAVIAAIATTYVVAEGPSNVMHKITGGNDTAAVAIKHPGHHRTHHGKQNTHNHGHTTTTTTAPASHKPSPKPTPSSEPTKLVPYTTGPSETPSTSPPSESPSQSPTTGSNPVAADFKLHIASYNFLGSVHTPAKGSRSGPERAKLEAKRIIENKFIAVGTQEFEANQRKAEMHLLGNDYGVFPKNPNYGFNNPHVNSVNSIIWNKLKLKFKGGESLDMTYFKGREYHIPLVKFMVRATGQEFYIANTHDPAHKQYAKYRFQDALRHAKDAKKITASGMPLIFVGDFNSGRQLMQSGNVTYQNDPDNLAYKIMAKKGDMHDSYAVCRNHKECTDKSVGDLGKTIVAHVFVSPGINIHTYKIMSKNTGTNDRVVATTLSLPSNSVGVG